MKREIFGCDICSKEWTRATGAFNMLRGLNFKNMSAFELGDLNSTEGKHICIPCLSILYAEIEKHKEELNKVAIN